MFPGQLCQLSIFRQVSSSSGSSTTCLLLFLVLYQVCHSFTFLSGMFNSGIESGCFQHYSAPKAPGQPPHPFTTDSFANGIIWAVLLLSGQSILLNLTTQHLPATGDLPSNSLPVFHVHFKFADVSSYASIPAMSIKTITKINRDTKNVMTLCFTAFITIKGKCKMQKAWELHKTWLAK